MTVLLSVILLIILVSRLSESVFKLPFTLALITSAYLVSHLFPVLFENLASNFDEILFMMLPVILLPDILQLSLAKMRENIGVLLYLSVVAVLAAVSISSLAAWLVLDQYEWTVGMLAALFSMLMATDAITVTSVFHRFNLPEKLKIYAEGESLLNDITALILFFFVALPMLGTEGLDLSGINWAIGKVLILSILLGMGVAALGYVGLKLMHDPFEQLLIIYLVSIASFVLAEHFHVAGILSIVASIMTFKYFVDRENLRQTENIDVLEPDAQGYYSNVLKIIKSIPAVSGKDMWAYKKEAYYIGLFANAVVFIAIANLVKIEQILNYIPEILVIFVITTVARYIMTQGLVFVPGVPTRWRTVLTFSGMKGGLAIIMAHSLPADFVYREMFETIVVGIVILSTFLYTFILMAYLAVNRKEFASDRLEQTDFEMGDMTRRLQSVVEKDPVSGAFNPVVFEDRLEDEISRALRYKTDLSLVIIKLSSDSGNAHRSMQNIGHEVRKLMRTNDIFGRLDTEHLAIIGTNTPVEGALVFAGRLKEVFSLNDGISMHGLYMGVAPLSEGDTVEMFIEHAQTNLKAAH
jgi:CPA1 family monovalent cation:H+ antiporter